MFEKEATEYATVNWEVNFDKVTPIINEIKFNDWRNGAEFGYEKGKEELTEKLDIAIEIIEQMKDLFFTCWQEKGYNAIKFEQKVNDFLKENK